MSGASVRIEPLTMADVAAAVELAVRVLGVKPGDRGKQFAADITGEQRRMFVAKANGPTAGSLSWQQRRRVRELRLATTSAVCWSTRRRAAGVSQRR